MTDSYYKDALLDLAQSWTVNQLDNYIRGLEIRLENTKDQIKELRALRRRLTRNSKRDTGERGGK